MKGIRGAWKRNTGQVLIIFVLAVPVLLGMSALVVDLGNLFAQKRNLQKAADAAALAATQALPPSPDQLAPDPFLGCSVPSQCDDNVKQFASNFSSGNGAPTPLLRCDIPNITTNCYDLVDNSIPEKVCPATGPGSTTCVPVRVQVTLSRTITTFFGGIIGKRDWVVHATARALKTDAVTTVAGTVITVDGVVTTTPDTVTTTPDIVTSIGGTVTTIPGTVTTIPGTVTTTPETVTTGPDVVVTTQLPGGPALLQAKSTSCADPVPLKINGADSEFHGGVISNGGVTVLSSRIKGDEMLWGHGTNPSCVLTKPADWGGSISEASHIFDWIVPLPICAPATACTPGSTTVATSITDDKGNTRACMPFSPLVSEVQRVTVNLTSGSFTLSWKGQTTGTLPFNASANAVKNALEGLSNIGNGNVAVTRSGSVYQVTFQGGYIAQMTASAGVAIATTQTGAGFNPSNPQPGLYCSTAAISLPNNKSLTATGGFGFVAPSIDLANGQEYRGYSQLYGAYGGFFLFAYDGNVKSAGSGTGFKGTIFSSRGDVSLAGSSSSAVCDVPNVGGCGFIEAQTISLTGANAHWQGLGPGVEGGTVTTTTPGTVTTIPATTTTTPDTVTTTPETVTTTGGVGTTTPGTVTTTPGGVTTTPPTVTTTPASTVTTPSGPPNLDK